MSDRHYHAASRVTHGAWVSRPDGGASRFDIETCACGARRSVLTITPPGGQLEDALLTQTTVPGCWDRP